MTKSVDNMGFSSFCLAAITQKGLPNVSYNSCEKLSDNLNEWLTTKEAATYLRISEASLRNMCSLGKIPYYKLERRNRFRLSDLQNLLLASKQGGFH